MRISGLASLLSLVLTLSTSATSGAFADENLVIELPAFPGNTIASAPSAGPASLNMPKMNPAAMIRPKQGAPVDRRAYLRQTVGGENSIGRLGVASKGTSIYSRQTSRSRVLSTVPMGTYLALTSTGGSWYGVLMQDRTVGWLRKSAVQLLDFAVVSNQPIGPLANSGEPPVLNGGGGYQAILQTAYYYLGVPYKWGGTSDNGMDCSAFVRKCFQAVGISLPRTSREQINVGMDVDPNQLQPCDRLYFANRSGTITHTGIYIGDGYFIHSSSSRGGVAVSRLNEPMYRRMFAGARR